MIFIYFIVDVVWFPQERFNTFVGLRVELLKFLHVSSDEKHSKQREEGKRGSKDE